MGNCCSDVKGGEAPVGGTSATAGYLPNEAANFFFKSRGFRGSLSEIELSFSATNLLDRDTFSKRDPMLVLYTKKVDGSLKEVARTEVILNSLNPQWITKYNLSFHFELVQGLLFRVYDIDTPFHSVDVRSIRLEEQQFLGESCCVLSEIVTKSSREVTLTLTQPEKSYPTSNLGTVTVNAEVLSSSKTVEIVLRCSELVNKDMFTRIDPFLVIYKVVENGRKIPLCKTEVVKNDQNPVWNSLFLNVQHVSDKESPLVIECYNFKSNGKHDLVGKTQKSLSDLERLFDSGEAENFFVLSDDTNFNTVLKSKLYVQKFLRTEQFTFFDYLKDGCQLSFMVAVDFTASNGNPRLPDSLHYIDPSGRPNSYQQAIMEVGGVLQFYDYDKQFPAWGFGARPIDGPVSHCFNLNGSIVQSEVNGVQGILTAYTSALFNVSLAGPTLFGPVINSAAFIARETVRKQEKKYHVLLIITDGVVTDLQETKDAIVKASELPLSIVIVGVGGADFEEMEILDADDGKRLESSSGRAAFRDIVQFVPLRQKRNGEISVVRELLAELPSQFLAYMKAKNILPVV